MEGGMESSLIKKVVRLRKGEVLTVVTDADETRSSR